MSPQIIEGIIKASSKLQKSFMLICTKNQIDWSGGYVNNWKTSEYVEFVRNLLKKYYKSKVYLCRDHCGPGFKNHLISDVYKTINDDIDNGFHLIHIDFSKYSKDHEKVINKTIELIKHIIKRDDKINIEIGTEEIDSDAKNTINKIKKDYDYISRIVSPEFFVVRTGSLVKEIEQIGSFNKVFVKNAHDILHSKSVKLKEHNADYLNKEDINKRIGIVDAINVAPQLGVIQTIEVLTNSITYGIDINPFLECCFKSKKWKKWLLNNSSTNKLLCSIISGHYNFTTDEYKKLISGLEKYIDINNSIINKIVSLVKYYSDSFTN